MNRLQAELDANIRLELLGHMITDTFWDGFEHSHLFDEILYVLKGPIVLLYNGCSVELGRGEFAFMPKNTVHQVMSREPASFVYLGFQTNLVKVSEIITFPNHQTGEITRLSRCLEETCEKALEDGIPLESFSSVLLVDLIPALCSLKKASEEKDQKQLLSDKVKHYVKQNLHKPIRVNEIAAGLYHSPHYVGSVFATVNGVTIKEYVLQYKMQKALTLLSEKGQTVSGVAGKLGYDSSHYFSKCFKSYYGFSPSKLAVKMEE